MLTLSNNESRKQWRLRWLSILFEFSHLEYQKSHWIDLKFPNGNGMFGEYVCQYFDDLYLDDNYQNQLQDDFVTIQEFEAIKPFHFAFREYDLWIGNTPRLTEEQILQDPKWKSVVNLGLKGWLKLKEVIPEEIEKEHMLLLEIKHSTE